MAKIPVIDKNTCIGCGTCEVIAPGTFKVGDSGKAKVNNPPKDSKEKIEEAIDSCPVEAISLSESD